MSTLLRPLFVLTCVLLAACQPPNQSRYSASDGSAIEIELPKLLLDGHPVVQYELATPSKGSVRMLGARAVYTPDAGAQGEDRFGYRLFDGDTWRESAQAIVELPKPAKTLNDSVRIDQLAMRGTHNSYHVLPPTLAHPTHNYTQPPLFEQFNDSGVRQIELDVHLDYVMNRIEVYHILGIDATTRCTFLASCLDEIALWSDTHPQHAPIMLWIEVKDFTGGRKFKDLNLLEADLRSHLGARLATPTAVQGGYASLNAAVRERGWPTLGEMRGKVVAIWLNPDDYPSIMSGFTDSAGNLGAHVLFPKAGPGDFDQPWAAITKLGVGDGLSGGAHARHLLIAANGCMADESDQVCADTLAAARAEGIHMLGSDKPALISRLDGASAVHCNAVTAPAGCNDLTLE